MLAELSGRHPGLRVEVTQTEPDHALAALRQREFDIAVCDEYDAYPRPRLGGLTCDDLYVERIHLVLPRNHPAKRLRDLADACWAGGHPATSHERLVLQACAAHGGFQPDIRHRATDLLVLLALVTAGQAVTLLPNLAHPRRDHAVDVRDTGVSRRVFTAVRDSALALPALDTVCAALRATARGITEPADRLLGRGGDRDVSRS